MRWHSLQFKSGKARGILAVLLVTLTCKMANAATATNERVHTPASPLEFYNDGAQKLRDGKLREAEASLQTAVASQNERVQASALYNLGHVRFREGVQELTNSMGGDALKGKSQHATKSGGDAIKSADAALASDDLQDLVAAYQQGRGAQKELRAATDAVKHALESYRNVLLKWQRASGDFKSTVELHPSDTNAEFNAQLVDRNIAFLVDLQQMMSQSADAMGKQKQELRDKMGQMKKKLPQDLGDKLKGDGDEEDEDGEKPKEPKPGTREGSSKDGAEVQLTAEEAEHWLGMLRLDVNRKLPMGIGDTENIKPKDRKGRDW